MRIYIYILTYFHPDLLGMLVRVFSARIDLGLDLTNPFVHLINPNFYVCIINLCILNPENLNSFWAIHTMVPPTATPLKITRSNVGNGYTVIRKSQIIVMRKINHI